MGRNILTRRGCIRVFGLAIVLLLVFRGPSVRRSEVHGPHSSAHVRTGTFERITVRGFDSIDPELYTNQSAASCNALSHGIEFSVQKSWHMKDDLWEIAGLLDNHPMVRYNPAQVEGLFDLQNLVKASWSRLATACVLLPEQDVYLCITRIIFHAEAEPDQGKASFIRGQIFDRSWHHLDEYRLMWKSQVIVFPRIFDVPFDFDQGGIWWGPEDARIIIEQSVRGAEPVIVFNMIVSRSTGYRKMWIFRPFSLHTTLLTVHDSDPEGAEKNWAPFFVDDPDLARLSHGSKQPNTHIHFVYTFSPLRIVKCSLIDGLCDQVFVQEAIEHIASAMEGASYLRGGTQFVPIPLHLLKAGGRPTAIEPVKAVQAFVALPRTTTFDTKYCKKAFYRPHLTIMMTDGVRFALVYGSEPIDFGPGMVVDGAILSQPCGSGRIMVPNGIADWDYSDIARGGVTDIMTLQVSMNDVTVQTLRLSGVLNSIKSLPSVQRMLLNPTSFFHHHHVATEHDPDGAFLQTSVRGYDIAACMEESAKQYIEDHTEQSERNRIEKEEKEKAETNQNKQGKTGNGNDVSGVDEQHEEEPEEKNDEVVEEEFTPDEASHGYDG